MKFTNFKISRESIIPIEDAVHVRSRKTFYHISVHFRNPGFRLVSKPQKLVFIFTTGPTTNEFKAYFHLKIYILCYLHIMASPGLKRGSIQHFMASFEDFLCACRRDKVVGERSCVVPAAFLLLFRNFVYHDSPSIKFYIVE